MFQFEFQINKEYFLLNPMQYLGHTYIKKSIHYLYEILI